MARRGISLAVIGSLLAVIPAALRAGSDPAYDWRTLATEHFRIHYYQGAEDLAQRAAAIAEEAYRRTRDTFGLEPSEVVEVVIRDPVDAANAFTSVYPYDRIEVLAFPPEPDSELAYYDDPLRTLVFHEYAHVVQMDQFSGAPRVVNRILGKTMLPNGAVPAWFSEGFATFVESTMTGGGRIGSSLYDMYLRTAALEEALLDLSELTEAPVRLPRGTAPYLYGSYFFDYLARRVGVPSMIAFIRDAGRRLIPFALNHLARRHFGADFASLYDAFLAEVRERARRTEAEVRALGLREGRAWTQDGEGKAHPVFSEDGKTLYYVRSDARSTTGVFALDLETGAQRRVLDCYGGCGRLERDAGGLLTTHFEPYRVYSAYQDLFRIDLNGSRPARETRWTCAARVRDPARVSDGRIIFATSRFHQVALAVFDPETGEVTFVVPFGEFQGLAQPRAVPGSDVVVFTGARAGRWDLWLLDLRTGTVRALTEDSALDRDPVPTSDGRSIVFSSDRDGIFNLYSIDLVSGRIRRLTRVIGGAFQPAVSPDGRLLAYVSWSARGQDLAILPMEPAEPERDLDREPHGDPYEPAPTASVGNPYSPWPSWRPRSLKPRYLATSVGLSRIGAEVTGEDAVGRHRFGLSFETDTTAWRPSASLGYAYERFFPTLGLDLATAPSQAFAFVDDRWSETSARDWVIGVSAFQPWPLRERTFSVGFGYSLQWTTGISNAHPVDPASSQPIAIPRRRAAAFTVSVAHDSTESYAWSISPERGFAAGLSWTLRRREIGGQGNSVTLGGYWYGYLPMPWRSGHVLALMMSAGWSRGDRWAEASYSLGGFPRQDVIAALINRQPLNFRGLRGFEADTMRGNTYWLVNAEYRAPLAILHRGLETFPAVARRVWLVAFVDTGAAWRGLPARGDPRWDLGAEVALSGTLFLSLRATLRLGYAHGFGEGGADVIYLVLTP